MTTLSEQKEIEPLNSLTNRGNHFNEKSVSFYRYLLRCNSCSWSVPYFEHSGLLVVSQKSIICPVWKDGEIDSSTYLQYG
jgi:hypothetical protein